MENTVTLILRYVTALIAIAGLVMIGVGWYLHSREPSPTLVFVILGILASVLGIKIQGSPKMPDPDLMKPEGKKDQKPESAPEK